MHYCLDYGVHLNPYGFSTYGTDNPTPVVLTRFVAGEGIGGREQEILLESAGAPGMSGGPVFIEMDSDVKLLGLYTGLIYPDHMVEENEKSTALGTCADISMCLRGYTQLVQNPSQTATIR
jgi:hypothetical protein